MKVTKNTITFNSGRVLCTNNGIIGLSEFEDVIQGGYNGDLCVSFDDNTKKFKNDLTPNEIDEICEYMIGLWERLLDKYGSGQTYVPGTFVGS